jgi:5,10-methenyltetrahydrofolate synthetase
MSKELSRDDLRHTLLAQRASLFGSCHADCSGQLVARLRALLIREYKTLGNLNVGAYLPIGSEPDISPLFDEFASVALPKVVGHAQPLVFLRYRRGDPLTREALGVQVPSSAETVEPELLLVPCLGFHVRSDGRIDRIGYGGGFYDRTLAARRAATIGISFAICQIEEFEAKAHDQPLDGVVTESMTHFA